MKIQVVDNVLDDRQYTHLSGIALGSEMPWYYVPNIAIDDPNEKPSELHSGFSHNTMNMETKTIESTYAFTFLPILFEACKRKDLFVSDVIQSRLFCHPAKPEANIQNGKHRDLLYDHKVCLYYFNDSDGDTVFFDDDDNEIFRQTPKKNTAVIFDGNIQHCSSTPTQRRVILNINFLLTH